ncbi:hypothetical protein [Natrialba sp. INN-245]|uniref:DUF7523 family protein n=1 Tax=Natrialba sp. INN-245 TaxID=2690967 RepID=UPI00131204A2|nr:hypothetical protein [Natrialba sp. INN-245]MWV41143.1 hypothetical protein [Natrialba sp. INN-245]
MSLAAATRRAVDEHPFLVAALRADVVNYTAAARFLAVDGETDAVATALRRYASELPAYETSAREARVRMESGVGPVDPETDDALVSVGGVSLGADGGDRTAIVATGEVDAAALGDALKRLTLEGIDPGTAAVGDGTMVVVVERLEGANAVRAVEQALENSIGESPQ